MKKRFYNGDSANMSLAKNIDLRRMPYINCIYQRIIFDPIVN